MGSWRDNFTLEPIELNSLKEYKKEYKKSFEEGYILISNNVTLDFTRANNDFLRIDNTPQFSFANGYYVSEKIKKTNHRQ